MPVARNAPPGTPFSISRTLAFAVALATHILLLMGLCRPPAPARIDGIQSRFDTREALTVRLLPRRAPRHSEPARMVSTTPRPATVTPRHATVAHTPAPSATTTVAPPPVLPATDAPGYVAGGRAFARALSPAAPPALPGGADVPGMPRFRMANPQKQGVAGVARLLQVFTGTADPACVDVDRWGTMTEQQRIAQHASAADMMRIAIEHNCAPPPDAKNR